MDQLDFFQLLKPVEVEPVSLTAWEKMKAGMQDYDLAEERARILNQGKKMK
jgi:hypothetical protein